MKRVQKIYDDFFKSITEYKSWKKKEFDLFFSNIITSDPSFNKKYSRWLCDIFLKKGFLEEDIIGENNKIFETLKLYEKNKKRIQKNLNQYDSIGSLWKDIKDFSAITVKEENKEEREKAYQESNIILREKRTMSTEDGDITGDFIIVSPITEDAAKWWGKGTRWCTSAENNNMFKSYNDDAPLIIFIMPNKDKLQFHYFENNLSFMDENDNSISSEYIEKHFDFFKEIFYEYQAFFYFPEYYLKNSLEGKTKNEWLESSDEFISGYVQSLKSEKIIEIPDFLQEFLFEKLSIKDMYYGNELENNFITELFSKNKIFKHSLYEEYNEILSEIDWSDLRNKNDDELTKFLKIFTLNSIENNNLKTDIPELNAYNRFHHILSIKQFEKKDLNNLNDTDTKILNKVLQMENIRWEIPTIFQEKQYLTHMLEYVMNNFMKKESFNSFFNISYDNIEKTSKTTNSMFIKKIQKIEKEKGEDIFNDNEFYYFGISDYTSLIGVDKTKLTDETLFKILKENPRSIIAFKDDIHKIPDDVKKSMIKEEGIFIHYFLNNCSQELIDLSLETTGIFAFPKDKYCDYGIQEEDLAQYYKNAFLHDNHSIRYIPDTHQFNFTEEEKKTFASSIDISHWKRCGIDYTVENIKKANRKRVNFHFYKDYILDSFSLDDKKTLLNLGFYKVYDNLKKNNIQIDNETIINCIKTNPKIFYKIYKEGILTPENIEDLTEQLIKAGTFPDSMLFILKTEEDCEKLKNKDNIFSMPNFYVEKFIEKMTIDDLIEIYDIDEGIVYQNKMLQEKLFYKSQELFLEKEPGIQFKI